ncbi:hypothetical protein ACA910_015436 [Epithemia clementina (nom. ined.)]
MVSNVSKSVCEFSKSETDVESREHTVTASFAWSSSKISDIEQIAERIENRRSQRLAVTFKSRVRFLHDCHKIVKRKDYSHTRISKKDLYEYRDKIQAEYESGAGMFNSPFFTYLDIKSDIYCLTLIVERAVELLESDYVDTGDWLYYRDFSADHTRIVSRFPRMRNDLAVAALVVLFYYSMTPVLFCLIMPSSNICDTTDQYLGVIASFYFASTTISTVGYGDLTVDQGPPYRPFVGILYMLFAMVVAVVALSAIASSTFSPLERVFERIFERFNPKDNKDLFLYQRIRKIKFVKLTELAVEILCFILLGIFGSQLVIYFANDLEEGADWSWMTSFYWATQTATTIGYGDLNQPKSLRYFNIFYLLFSTILVGNALGKLGTLKEEMQLARRRHAWDRRPITKRMIDEMQAYDHDDKVDQYEFLVSSLIYLGYLDSERIAPIMEKFRSYAGKKGYISAEQNIDDDPVDEDLLMSMEDDYIDSEE